MPAASSPSDRPAGHRLAVSVASTTLWASPDAARDVDAPILAAVPDPAGWAAGLDHAARLDLDARVHTQLLLGEPVEVVGERDGWLEVVAPWQPSDRDPRGYPGWIPAMHAAEFTEPGPELEAVVTVRATDLRSEPDGGELVLRDVSYATILPVVEHEKKAVRIALPGHASGWLARDACRLPERTDGRAGVRADDVLASARGFVGLDYLWGGMNAFGLDCSGLVHIAFRALGNVVPRDAHDQAAASRQVPVSQARAGDLLFFARPGKSIHHVGFATGAENSVLHAPGTGHHVEETGMNEDRRATLHSAGRFTE